MNLLTQGVRQVIGLDPSSRLLEMVRRTGLSRQAKAIEAEGQALGVVNVDG